MKKLLFQNIFVAIWYFLIMCNLSPTISGAIIDIVNDNYCDRADGSDETLTSACSYLPVKFTCSNGKLLFTSRVNDGVCDCCDGGDEYDSPIPLKCTNVCEGAPTKHSILFGSSHAVINYPLSKEQRSLVVSNAQQLHSITTKDKKETEERKEQEKLPDVIEVEVPRPTRFTIKLDKQKILLANRLAKKKSSSSFSMWMFLGGVLLVVVLYCLNIQFHRSRNGPILATYNNNYGGGGDSIYLHGQQRPERGYAGSLQTLSYFLSGLVRTAWLRASQCCSREVLGGLWSGKPNTHTV